MRKPFATEILQLESKNDAKVKKITQKLDELLGYIF